MHAVISIPPTRERQYPGSSHPTRLGTPSWCHIPPSPSPGSAGEMLGSPASISGVGYQQRAPPGTRDAVVVPRAGAADVCSQDAREKHLVSSTQPNRARPSRNNHPSARMFPSTRAFVLKTQPRISPLAARCTRCQSPAGEREPVIFIRGCSLWGPSAASQEKQATGENWSLLMAFSSPPLALAAARGQLLLQKTSTSGASWFLPCSAATSQIGRAHV